MCEYTQYLLNDEEKGSPFSFEAGHLYLLRYIKQAFEATVKKEE